MKRNAVIGMITGVAAAAVWSLVFVRVLHSAAGIGVGLALGAAFGLSASLIFKDSGKKK